MAERLLKVPYFSQTVNKWKPSGTCGITSLAMVLAYYGIVGDGNQRLPDHLIDILHKNGLDTGSPRDLATVAAMKGLKDRFTSQASQKDIRAAIDKGVPVIVHTEATRSGHILVITGYSDAKRSWVVNDPWGEYYASGYVVNSPANPTRGKGLLYSYGLMESIASPETSDATIWAHFISK